MTKKFTHKTAIVTGAGQGIGFEIARQLALQGASVLLNDIDEKLAKNASLHIIAEGGSCCALAGDVADVDFIHRMVDTAVRQFGKVDIAIANAGITLFGDFLTYPVESLQSVM